MIKWIKKRIPSRQSLEQNRFIKPLMPILRQSEHYWTFSRHSVSWGCAVAAFGVFMPMPFQTIVALLLALPLRANLILAIGLLWFNNPITIVPIYLLAYDVGTKLLHITKMDMPFHLSTLWFRQEIVHIWQPLLLGCVICGLICAGLVYVITHVIWDAIKRRRHQPSK